MTVNPVGNSANSMHVAEIDYNHIIDGIYIGTNQCCRMHFDELLKNKEGITADISLEENHLDMPFGVDFYTWLPTVDDNPSNPDQLALGASILKQLAALGH